MRLRILNWDKHFETAKSRSYLRSSKIYMPNKMGLGLKYILSLPDGSAVFGNFVLMAEACSTQAAPRLGFMSDDGNLKSRFWNYEDISLRIQRPVEEIARCVAVCLCDRVGWIEDLDLKRPRGIRAISPEYPSVEIRGDKRRVEESRGDKLQGPSDPSSAFADSPSNSTVDSFPSGFIQFWSAYPRRGRARSGRAKCSTIWQRRQLETRTDEILAGISRWLQSDDWSKKDGEYIPGAHRFLSEERWLNAPEPKDELPDFGAMGLAPPNDPTEEQLIAEERGK